MEKEILKLTKIWYKLASLDHHKDRDCHWYINTIWSYGDEPTYRVEHFGYIFGDHFAECKTYKEAEKKLLKLLKEAINSQKEWAEKVLKEPAGWDEGQRENAKDIKTLTTKI